CTNSTSRFSKNFQSIPLEFDASRTHYEKLIAPMLPRPRADLTVNTAEYERAPLVSPNGFREYDARWLFEKEINLYGVQALGLGLGTLIHQRGVRPDVVTGHDFRSYSAAIKHALITGLMASGCIVHDIGLALSPMAYFAQFAL